MASPDPGFLETLPPSTQIVINIAIFIGAVWMALRGYAGKKTAPDPSTDIVLAGGAFTDMKPVREIAIDVKRMADAVERIASSTEERAEDDEIERRARVRAAEIVAHERAKSRS